MAEKRITTKTQRTRAPRVARKQSVSTELEARIAQRAYERYAGRGYQHGHDVEDWLAAEAEVRAEAGR